MSLDVSLYATRPAEIFTNNITHNLNHMAMEAGIYEHIWRPEELDIVHAYELVEPLEKGLAKLKCDSQHFIQFNPTNGWGNYETLVTFVENYLIACKNNPDAIIRASR